MMCQVCQKQIAMHWHHRHPQQAFRLAKSDVIYVWGKTEKYRVEKEDLSNKCGVCWGCHGIHDGIMGASISIERGFRRGFVVWNARKLLEENPRFTMMMPRFLLEELEKQT